MIASIGAAGLRGQVIQLDGAGIFDFDKVGPFVQLRQHLLGQIYDQIHNAPGQRRSDPYAATEDLSKDQVSEIRKYFRNLQDDQKFGAIVLRIPTLDGVDFRSLCEDLAATINATVIEGLAEHEEFAYPDTTFTAGDLSVELQHLLHVLTNTNVSAESSSTRTRISSPAGARSGYDVFISYASEDREPFVSALVEQLRAIGLRPWWDQGQLSAGDVLMNKINAGLSRSRFGVVILSPAFTGKPWPESELSALFSREMLERRKCIIPVLLDLDQAGLVATLPLLAGKLHIRAADGVEHVANQIAAAVSANP